MHKRILKQKAWLAVFANDNDAYVPEVWAQESLMILEANMVAASLVHRDFSNEIQQFGDVVNTRRPAEFTMKRKTDTDGVTKQDATATNVAVKLDQHLHTSFIIKDGEESKGFKNLVVEYLSPALLSIAQGADEIILGQMYEFMAYNVGKLGTDLSKSTVIAAREVLNVNKCPQSGRSFITTPNGEGNLLNIGDFIKANEIGDDGSALREANLGRKMGFNFFMDQNAPSIATGSTIVTGAINNGAGYAVGDTALTVDGLTAAIENGAWCTIAGDMTPQKITGTVGGATPTQITIAPGLYSAVVDGAVVTVYTPGEIDLGAGYASGYAKDLVINGFTVAPKKGQLVSIGSLEADTPYSLLSTPTTTAMLLNKTLQSAVIDNANVGIGPAGDYNFAFHKNAISFVSRPLATPMAGTGALSSVADNNGIGVRVTITYDGTAQGHLVTVDLLCGVKTLDTKLGCIVYS